MPFKAPDLHIPTLIIWRDSTSFAIFKSNVQWRDTNRKEKFTMTLKRINYKLERISIQTYIRAAERRNIFFVSIWGSIHLYVLEFRIFLLIIKEIKIKFRVFAAIWHIDSEED